MKTTIQALLVLFVGIFVCSTPGFAHHGYAAYDMTKTLDVKATITSFDLANPHSTVEFDVKDATGKVEHWAGEMGPPVRGMREAGWTEDTLKPGDQVTITYNPRKDGQHLVNCVKFVFADGHVKTFAQPTAADLANPHS